MSDSTTDNDTRIYLGAKISRTLRMEIANLAARETRSVSNMTERLLEEAIEARKAAEAS